MAADEYNKTFYFEGSEGSAAGGGSSDLSEWPWSVSDAGVRAKESTGYRNRNGVTTKS